MAVRSTLTDDRTGSLFSKTVSYTTPLWLAEKANLRKISYQSGIHKKPETNTLILLVFSWKTVTFGRFVPNHRFKPLIYYSHMIFSLQKAKYSIGK